MVRVSKHECALRVMSAEEVLLQKVEGIQICCEMRNIVLRTHNLYGLTFLLLYRHIEITYLPAWKRWMSVSEENGLKE